METTQNQERCKHEIPFIIAGQGIYETTSRQPYIPRQGQKVFREHFFVRDYSLYNKIGIEKLCAYNGFSKFRMNSYERGII